MRDAEIIITGMGAASALGTGCEAHLEALRTGRDGLRPVTRFDTSGFSSRLGGTWPAWDGRVQREPKRDDDIGIDFPVSEIALAAAKEAWHQAKLDQAIEQDFYHKKRGAFLLGTCFGQSFREFHPLAERIAAALELRGVCATISTACSSSTNAIGLARDLLRRGDADFVLAGGADVLLREVFAGFSSLGVLSAEKCAPFSEALGTTLGEGACFFVLERREQALARGASGYASIHGYGLSSDGYHETTPDPSGAGIARAIHGALQDAGWTGDSVDFVSAHATGTATNDRIEWAAIQSELGERSAKRDTKSEISVSGSKSQLGHAQGAAGALELCLSILAMSHGQVPPTLHFTTARAGCPADPNAGVRPRSHRVRRALKLSSAFGGANAVLAFAPVSEKSARASAGPHAQVVVRGLGVVGPGAAILEELETLKGRRLSGAASAVDLRRAGVDPRRLDASSRLLVAAASAALEDAKKTSPRGAARARAGLFVGATRMPEESAARCRESMRLHGAARASASAFARMSVNSPAGACSRLLGLFGPSSTVSIGEGSGLFAIALAAEWLATREDADILVAGSVDERSAKRGSEEALASEQRAESRSEWKPNERSAKRGSEASKEAEPGAEPRSEWKSDPRSAKRGSEEALASEQRAESRSEWKSDHQSAKQRSEASKEAEQRTEPDHDEAEGAACALLERVASPSAGDLVISGWGFAGPDDPASAVEQALGGRSDVTHVFSDGVSFIELLGVDSERLSWVDVSRWCAYSEATRSTLAFAAAVAALRRRTCAAALVVTSRSDSAHCALLLTSSEST